MDKKDKDKQETKRIKSEALTKRSSIKKNSKTDETQVVGKVKDNNKKKDICPGKIDITGFLIIFITFFINRFNLVLNFFILTTR